MVSTYYDIRPILARLNSLGASVANHEQAKREFEVRIKRLEAENGIPDGLILCDYEDCDQTETDGLWTTPEGEHFCALHILEAVLPGWRPGDALVIPAGQWLERRRVAEMVANFLLPPKWVGVSCPDGDVRIEKR